MNEKKPVGTLMLAIKRGMEVRIGPDVVINLASKDRYGKPQKEMRVRIVAPKEMNITRRDLPPDEE